MSITDPGTPVPAGLRTPELVLRPITADDVERDHAAVMETREQLRLWEQSTWPAEQVVQQADLLRGTDLRLRFELREPGKAGTYLVFG